MHVFSNLFERIASLENLYLSFNKFKKGKRDKPDAQLFERFFDKAFIYDSYSCRLNKGTHRAVDRLEKFTRIVSQNYTRPCLALKCDIKKFFASVDHQILIQLINKKVRNKDILWLVKEIIQSFNSRGKADIGLPLGNLTSQLFANIYLDELDQFIKHKLKIKYYLRYGDDFIILDTDKNKLEKIILQLSDFLPSNLKLTLHPSKIIIRKLRQGIDFLGYIVLPHYRVLRTKTKKRMMRRLNQTNLPSYLGLIKHCDSYRLKKQLINKVRI